jgi:transposase
MLGLSANLRYFLCTQTIDMRNGFDGLAGIVRNSLGQDPVSGDVFIFINKRRSHIKMLYWDGDGFALYYKRLERGRYTLSKSNSLSKELKRNELLMLLEGLSFKDFTRKKRYKIS